MDELNEVAESKFDEPEIGLKDGLSGKEWDEPEFDDVDMKQYQWNFDDNTITSEFDEALKSEHDEHADFVQAFNSAGGIAAELALDNIPGTELADIANDNPDIIDGEVAFFEGVGETMNDVNGGISEEDIFSAEQEYLAKQYTELEPEADGTQLENQMSFDDLSLT